MAEGQKVIEPPASTIVREPAAIVNVFTIINRQDDPIFEADLSSTGKRDDSPHLNQFVLHAALDAVEEQGWQKNDMYLKVVDKFNQFLVTCWLSAGNVRFLLLHKQRTDDNIRLFMQEIHELYVKLSCNPFHSTTEYIRSAEFNRRVRVHAQKYLL